MFVFLLWSGISFASANEIGHRDVLRRAFSQNGDDERFPDHLYGNFKEGESWIEETGTESQPAFIYVKSSGTYNITRNISQTSESYSESKAFSMVSGDRLDLVRGDASVAYVIGNDKTGCNAVGFFEGKVEVDVSVVSRDECYCLIPTSKAGSSAITEVTVENEGEHGKVLIALLSGLPVLCKNGKATYKVKNPAAIIFEGRNTGFAEVDDGGKSCVLESQSEVDFEYEAEIACRHKRANKRIVVAAVVIALVVVVDAAVLVVLLLKRRTRQRNSDSLEFHLVKS